MIQTFQANLLAAVLLLLGVIPTSSAQDTESYAFTVARVKYDGGGDWYSDPESLPELLAFVRQNTLIDVAPEEEVVELSSDNLYSFPYLYLTGHGNMHLPTLRRCVCDTTWRWAAFCMWMTTMVWIPICDAK